MNIPIPEGKIGVFKITGGGKKQYDGLNTPRFFCDDTEIPAANIQKVEIKLEGERNTVTVRYYDGLCDGKQDAHFSGEITLHPRTVQIDGYTPIGVPRREIREQSQIGGGAA